MSQLYKYLEQAIKDIVKSLQINCPNNS